MKLVRFISTITFYLSRIISAGYFLTTLHLLASIVFGLSTFKLLENGRFAICYPFTDKYFLLGSSYTVGYITEMVLIIAFYGTFFWLLSNVFRTFRQKRLFTVRGIQNLKLFYLTNLIICPILFLLLSQFSTEDLPYTILVIAHCIMGIFALFIAAIFRQGVSLQNDQDLII